jgi:aspartate carbamoyltransferase catalytic subunit
LDIGPAIAVLKSQSTVTHPEFNVLDLMEILETLGFHPQNLTSARLGPTPNSRAMQSTQMALVQRSQELTIQK